MSIRTRCAILIGALGIDAAVIGVLAPDYAEVGNIFWMLLTLKAWIFVGLYWFRSDWRATAGGRAIMRLIGCIAVIGVLSTGTIVLGDYPGRAFVRLGLLAAVALAMLDLLLTLVAAQNLEGD